MNSLDVVDTNRIKMIAKRIKETRKNTLISLQEMADFIGIGYEQYRRIEAGNVLVKTEYIISISSILNVSTDYLLFGMTEKEIINRELASLINDLSPEDTMKALKVLKAIFT